MEYIDINIRVYSFKCLSGQKAEAIECKKKNLLSLLPNCLHVRGHHTTCTLTPNCSNYFSLSARETSL